MSSEANEQNQNVKDFFKVTTTRPVAIFMIVVAVCVFGMVSYDSLLGLNFSLKVLMAFFSRVSVSSDKVFS